MRCKLQLVGVCGDDVFGMDSPMAKVPWATADGAMGSKLCSPQSHTAVSAFPRPLARAIAMWDRLGGVRTHKPAKYLMTVDDM